MKNDELEPLSSELASLFGRDAEPSAADAALENEVFARVSHVLALRGGGEGGGQGTEPIGGGDGAVQAALGSAAVKKIVLGATAGALAVGAVGGGAAGYSAGLSAGARVQKVEFVLPAPITSPTVKQAISDPPLSVVSSSELTTKADAPRPSTDLSAPTDLRRERELIDAARASLAKGNAKEALNILGTHAAKYPSGQLAPDRDALKRHAQKELARDGGAH